MGITSLLNNKLDVFESKIMESKNDEVEWFLRGISIFKSILRFYSFILGFFVYGRGDHFKVMMIADILSQPMP